MLVIVAALSIGGAIQNYFPRIPFLVGVIIALIGLYVAYYVLYHFFAKLFGGCKKIIERHRRCSHGVEHKTQCIQCEQEMTERIKRDEEERKEFNRKNEIRKRADALRKKQLDKVLNSKLKTLDYLLSLTPEKFEDLIAEMFRRLGYEVEQTPYVNDRGKDAILIKDSQKYVVECKRYGKGKIVGRPHLQKFYAAIEEEKAAKGYFITTGRFSSPALEFSGGFKIETIDGEELIKLMKKAFPGDDGVRDIQVVCLECGDIVTFPLADKTEEKLCSNGHSVESNITNTDIRLTVVSSVKHCRRCGKEMKIVHGRGGRFWGCTGYPICTYRTSFRD